MLDAPYAPPRPRPLPATLSLLRVVAQGDGDLLSLLPAKAYRCETGWLGWSRRSILIVNRPDLVKRVLADPDGIFPKNDLMVGAVEPLIGDSIFVSSGETWRRQRRMVAPAFSGLRLDAAYPAMEAAVDAFEVRLAERAGEAFSLDEAMSHLTADVICRTTFSTPLDAGTSREVFEAFKLFERSAAHVELKRLILDPAFREVAQHDHVLAACARIREALAALLAPHLEPDAAFDDIAAAVIATRDPETGAAFTHEALIDQLGVFFLAGHETSASALTWAFHVLAERPEVAGAIRAEVARVCGDGPVRHEHLRHLETVRRTFREVLRLYPPITFLPRVALEPCEIGGRRLKRGAMVMIAPWTVHRHRDLWPEPDRFDPDRFVPEAEKALEPGSYIPFGLGPRVCVGAAFAGVEAALVLARLARGFDWHLEPGQKVRPVARLTTRPAEEVKVRVTRRG